MIISLGFGFIFIATFLLSAFRKALKVNLSSTQCEPFPIIQISKTFSSLIYTYPTFDMCLGTPRQCFTLGLSFERPYTYLYGNISNSTLQMSKSIFDPQNSNTFSSNYTKFYWSLRNEIVAARVISDIPYFPSSPPFENRFNFALIYEYTIQLSDTISGYMSLLSNYYNKTIFNDSNLSFLKYLYDNGIIQEQSFTIDLDLGGNGVLSFGHSNDYSEVNEGNACNLILRELLPRGWECNMLSILIGDIALKGPQVVLFDIREHLIAGPYASGIEIFDLFINATGNICDLHNSLGDWTILCPFDVQFDLASDIIILFGGSGEMRLKWKILFSKGIANHKKVLISKLVLNKGRVSWTLGEPAFRGNIIFFDAENFRIGFPTVKKAQKDINIAINKHQLIYCFVVAVILLSFGLGILIAVKLSYVNNKLLFRN